MTSFSRTLKATCFAVAALGASMAVQAQTSSSSGGFYSPGSSYIGFNAGQSDFSVGNGNGVFPSDNKDNSYSLYGGSYFNNNFGVVLGFNDFGRVNRGGGETKAQGINFNLVGRLPLSPSFNLLGKLGTTYGRTESSAVAGSGVGAGKESGFGASYGIGVEYAFTPNVSAVLQYDEHDLKFAGQGRETINVTSVGLRYRF
jgi:OOP family OmpA-OmpF porin